MSPWSIALCWEEAAFWPLSYPWTSAESFNQTLHLSRLWNLLLMEDFNKDKSIQSRWVLTEKKPLPVEALNNIKEKKWNCNVWLNNGPSSTPLHTYYSPTNTHTHKLTFLKGFLQRFFWPRMKQTIKYRLATPRANAKGHRLKKVLDLSFWSLDNPNP